MADKRCNDAENCEEYHCVHYDEHLGHRVMGYAPNGNRKGGTCMCGEPHTCSYRGIEVRCVSVQEKGEKT